MLQFRYMQRFDQLLLGLINVISRCAGHFGTAALGWALDYVAFKIGRFWAVLFAFFVFRNGRWVPWLGLAADWLLAPEDKTFVCSLTILIALVSGPFIFPGADLPNTEHWHSYSKHGFYTTPLFVFYCVLLHYPDETVAAIKRHAARIVSAPSNLTDAVYVVWFVLACTHSLYAKVIANPSVHRQVDRFWKWVGKKMYDRRNPGATLVNEDPDCAPYVHFEIQGEWGFRLLHVLPQGNSGIVSCRLVHADLRNPPPYEALSYVWGDANRTRTILIDGKPFKTTKSVYYTLRDRNPVWAARAIWIDAVCIDQDDDEEKAAQVRIMRYIYREASHVLVCLGTGMHAHLAVKLVLELANLIEKYRPSDRQLYRRYVHERRTPRWRALGALVAHVYFSRVWMAQEVAVNRNLRVVYGGEVLRWETLQRVMLKIHLSFDFSIMIEDGELPGEKRTPVVVSSNAMVLDLVRGRTQRPTGDEKAVARTLMGLLLQFWTFDATDPRDKVFALVGLASDEKHPLVDPDYTKSVERVYLDAGRYLFSDHRALKAVLCCAGIGWPRTVDTLPSWVADWSTVGRNIIAVFPEGKGGYSAAGDLENRAMCVMDDNTFQVDAILLDTVERVGEEYRQPPTGHTNPQVAAPTVDMDRHIKWFREVHWLTASLGWRRAYRNGQSMEEAVWRTLVCDVSGIGAIEEDGGGLKWPAPGFIGTWYKYCMQYLLQISAFEDCEDFSLDEVPAERVRLGSRWVTSAQHRCYGRRFGLTRDGYMALVPALAEPGDVVALILGSPVPFLLRPSGCDESEAELRQRRTYRLVGECYVHGIMAGEAANASAVETIILV